MQDLIFKHTLKYDRGSDDGCTIKAFEVLRDLSVFVLISVSPKENLR